MKIVLRILMKDLRQHAWLLVLTLGWVALRPLARLLVPDPPGSDPMSASLAIPATIGVLFVPVLTVLVVIVAASIVLSDTPSGSRAHWKTLPIPWRHLLVAKSLIIVGLIVLVSSMQAWDLKWRGFERPLQIFADSALFHAALIGMAVATAALVPRIGTFVAAFLSVTVGFLGWFFAGSRTVAGLLEALGAKPALSLPDGPRLLALMILIAVGGGMVWACQLAFRNRRRTGLLALGLGLAAAVLSALPPSPAMMSAGLTAQASPRVRIHTPTWNDLGGGDRRLDAVAELGDTDSGHLHVLRAIRTRLTLEDGRAIERRIPVDQHLDRRLIRQVVAGAMVSSGRVVVDSRTPRTLDTTGLDTTGLDTTGLDSTRVPLFDFARAEDPSPASVDAIEVQVEVDVYRAEPRPISPASYSSDAETGEISVLDRSCEHIVANASGQGESGGLPLLGQIRGLNGAMLPVPEPVLYDPRTRRSELLSVDRVSFDLGMLGLVPPWCWTEQRILRRIEPASAAGTGRMLGAENAEILAFRWRFLGRWRTEAQTIAPP